MDLNNKITSCCNVKWYIKPFEDGIRIYCSKCNKHLDNDSDFKINLKNKKE